jgi:hypothetical protein
MTKPTNDLCAPSDDWNEHLEWLDLEPILDAILFPEYRDDGPEPDSDDFISGGW